MELRTRVSSRWLGPTGLSVQFALGHMAAALVGIVLAGSGQITLGLLAAAMTGLALTTGVQRTIWLLGSALTALKAGRSPDELSTRWHGPLAALVVNLNALIAREREIHELRSGLMQQAGEAAAQQERNRLARELHDSIKQQIFGINMSAAAAQARWESDPRCARAALEDVRRSGQEAMVEMNALLQQLSPVPLEKVGLRQALLDQCEALGYRTGAAVTAEFGELPDEDRLPPGAQKDLFRIAQEGLSNVARHARANNVHLYLGLDEAKSLLVLGIEDDGRGFNTDASHEGMGLPNIRERVQALGGLQSLDSRAGRGTTLSVHVPLLEPVLPEQVLPAYRLDHTMSRVVLVGLAGGMVLIAAMVYPLYVVLPGCLVEGWPRGSATVAFVLGLAAPLLAAATGFLAARWSRVNTRQASTLLGALAGGVAALLLYFGLAAPTAGVVGNAPLLVHGPVPASSDQEVVRLLSEAAIGLLWGVYGAFWIVLLGGVGLGAIGGLLAPLASTGPNRPTLRLSFIATLPPAIVTSTLCLLAALLVFPQPELSIRSAVVEAGGATIAAWSLAGVSLWPTCTSAALYLASLAALWFLLRTEITLGDVARLCTAYAQAGSVGLLALCVPGLILLMVREAFLSAPGLRAAVIVIIACSLLLASLYLATFVKAHQRRRALDLPRLPLIRTAAIVGALLSLGALAWAAALPSWLSIVTALVIIVANLALVTVLLRQPSPAPPGAVAMARTQLAMSRSINGALGSVVAPIVPLAAMISVLISFLAITFKFPAVLLGDDGPGSFFSSSTLAQAVHTAYSVQAVLVAATLVGAVAVVGLLILSISGRMSLMRRAVAQSVAAEGPPSRNEAYLKSDS